MIRLSLMSGGLLQKEQKELLRVDHTYFWNVNP